MERSDVCYLANHEQEEYLALADIIWNLGLGYGRGESLVNWMYARINDLTEKNAMIGLAND